MVLLPTALVRLSLAALLGACIGATRAYQTRTVWMRIHALVAVGSSLLTMTALFGFTGVSGTAPMQGDPTRIVSWIIVGSGLLGAGSLLGQRERPTVTGVTTAVLIWMVAVLGILCGAGWLIEAVGGALLTLSVLLLHLLVKRYFSSH